MKKRQLIAVIGGIGVASAAAVAKLLVNRKHNNLFLTDETPLDFNRYSEELDAYVTLNIYVKTADLLEHFQLPDNDPELFYDVICELSNDDIEVFIEKYGCQAIHID